MIRELPYGSPPPVVIGIDFETSDWDSNCSFNAQNLHHSKGFPCHDDHRRDSGTICQVGYAVFHRLPATAADDPRAPGSGTSPHHRLDATKSSCALYRAEDPVSVVVKLPEGEAMSKKAELLHKITGDMCLKGEDFADTLEPLRRLVEEAEYPKRGVLVAHNLPHESLVLCRDLQKRGLSVKFQGLQRAFHDAAYCTAKETNFRFGHRGWRLADAYRACCPRDAPQFQAHLAGDDAAMCGRLFIQYLGARVLGPAGPTLLPPPSEIATPNPEEATESLKKANNATSTAIEDEETQVPKDDDDDQLFPDEESESQVLAEESEPEGEEARNQNDFHISVGSAVAGSDGKHERAHDEVDDVQCKRHKK